MDTIDLSLVELLRGNARLSYAELARQVGLSAPAAFILAAVSILLASLAACAGPLIRATRVDRLVAIRAE